MEVETNEITHSKSQAEILKERRLEAKKNKAKEKWNLLQRSIRNTFCAITDIKNIYLSHGIYHKKRLYQTGEIEDVVLAFKGEEYVTLFDNQVQVFEGDGKIKVVLELEEPMNRLMYSAENNMFVGYNHGERVLYLMNSAFEIVSSSKSLAPITLGHFNSSTNEVITVGPGLLTAWKFRYNARYLLPRKLSKLSEFCDVEFGGLAMEDTASRSQRCFFRLDNGVVEYNVYEGRLIAHHKDLHSRVITALTFFNPLKYLVTGAKDGCIKVWDKAMQVLLVFVGHTDTVNYLGVYPYGPAVISASLDSTIRVWSLESCDEIDKTQLQEPISGLCSRLDNDTFITFSNKTADLWRIQHLYQMHTYIGYRVVSIRHTCHPLFPVRSVLLCKDSSVRLVSPETGDVITTFLQPLNKGLLDAAYAISQDIMFIVTGSGSIIKCRTDTNPCTVVAEWQYSETNEMFNYLLVYEYVLDGAFKEDAWAAMKRTADTKSLHETASKESVEASRTLLLGGTKDGYICVLNWKNGKVKFKIEAHGTKGVLSMIANSREDQLISAGMDNIIKVWRLYPFAEESLAPLMSFYCGHTPSHMVMMKDSLCVAFQDHSTATYSIVLYNLISKSRCDHKPDDDHQDTITGLTACQKLRLFASASLDGTVRIWSDSNQLVRVLKLGASPHSIGFCSQRGDILIAIGDHVCKIPSKAYLPRVYMLKMACMRFLRAKGEPPIPYDEDLLNQFSKHDLKRLKNAKASLKYDMYADLLTSDEEDEVTRESKEKEQGYSVLEERENELKLLVDGAITSKRKPRRTKRTQKEALRQYMKLYHNKPKITLPPDRHFEEEGDMIQPQQEELQDWIPEKEPTGFFPPSSLQKTVDKEGGQIPIIKGGFVPNSVLLRLLWPNPPPVKKIAKAYQLPTFSTKQLEEMGGEKSPEAGSTTSLDYQPIRRKKAERNNMSDRVIQMDLSDDEDDKEVPPSNLISKFEELIQKPPTPIPIEPREVTPVAVTPENKLSVKEEPIRPRTPTKTPPTMMVVKKPTAIPKPLPRKPIEKMVSPAPPTPATPESVETERVATPVAAPSPRPPTPLPEFITQFYGQEWFEKYFPKCSPETFPKPWTVEAFVDHLARLLKIASYKHKVDISAAIMHLNNMEGLSNPSSVCKSYLAVFRQPTPPTAIVEEEKTFIVTSLKAFQTLSHSDFDVLIEIMSQFIDGDKDVRATALGVLSRMGVQDPHGYLAHELDSWDTWNLEEGKRKSRITEMCRAWLDRWMTSFKIHLEDTISKLKKGQNVHGKLGQRKSPGLQKSSLRKSSQGETSPAGETSETMTIPDGVDHNQTKHVTHKAITLSMDSVTDSSILDNATYIEAINYFCEIMLEKELERMRGGTIPPISEDNSTQTKNTVLVLPKIQKRPALVRLGESHTSFCRPKREAQYADYYPPVVNPGQGQITSFPPSINLPLKTLYLNPFPSGLDDYDLRFQEPLLITLKSSQKYFIPDQSYCVDNLPPVPAAR